MSDFFFFFLYLWKIQCKCKMFQSNSYACCNCMSKWTQGEQKIHLHELNLCLFYIIPGINICKKIFWRCRYIWYTKFVQITLLQSHIEYNKNEQKEEDTIASQLYIQKVLKFNYRSYRLINKVICLPSIQHYTTRQKDSCKGKGMSNDKSLHKSVTFSYLHSSLFPSHFL